MSALLWVLAAVVLVAAEALSGELILLMLAGGALTTAGVDAVFDTPLWVNGVVFSASSLLLLAVVRPLAKRQLLRGPKLMTNVQALEGRPAVALTRIDDAGGRVQIDGEEWTARAMSPGEVIEVGGHVTVVQIDGATAVVWGG